MKNIFTFLLLCITSTILAQVSTQEKNALIDLYQSTNGNHWNTTWDLTQSVSDWNGVTVKDNKVVEVTLLFNNLEGNLPQSLNNLVHLEKLELSFNKIKGTLPKDLSNLTNLKVLALNGNNISGVIPFSIDALVSLEQLHLSSNQLSGTIPYTLASLKKLKTINLFDNNLSGMLPVGLQQLKNLEKLIIAENDVLLTETTKDLVFFTEDVSKESMQVIPASQSVIAIETPEEN